MQTITSTLTAVAPVGTRRRVYTQEEYEMAKRMVEARNSVCQPACPICGGSGYVRIDVPPTDSRFGRLQPCPNMYQVNLRKGATRYGLTAQEVEFLDWRDVAEINQGPAAAAVVRDVLALGYGFIYLWGDHGQAKSLILKIAIAASLRASQEAAYVNMTDLMTDLRTAYDATDPNIEAARRLEFWRTIPVLAIDEFNRINETEFVKEKRFALIDARNVQAIRQQSITLIASNTAPDAQESYLASRFSDGRFHVLALNGADARPMMTADSTI